MKILVTGGTGFLGSHLIKKLIAEGHDVTGLSRSLPKNPICPWIKIDLSDAISLQQKIIGFDAIFHTASKVGMWGKRSDFFKTNVCGTKNLLHAAIKNKIPRFIYTSSPSVIFEKDDLIKVDETTPYPLTFLTSYGETKSIAEDLVLKAGLKGEIFTVALRPHLIYGADDPHMIPRLVNAANNLKIRIIGSGLNLIDVIYIDNAVDAHICALTSGVSGHAYFISQEHPVNCFKFINSILKIFGARPITKKINLKVAYAIGAIVEQMAKIFNFEPPMTRFVALQLGKSHYFDTTRATRELNFTPKISVEQSLELMKHEVNK